MQLCEDSVIPDFTPTEILFLIDKSLDVSEKCLPGCISGNFRIFRIFGKIGCCLAADKNNTKYCKQESWLGYREKSSFERSGK